MAFNNPRINFIDKQADTCVNFTVQDSNLGDYRRSCTLEGFSDEKGVRIDGLLYGDFSSLRVENSIDLYDIGYEGITDLFFDNLKSLGLVDQNAELKLFVKEAEELKNIFYIIRSSFMAGGEPYFFDGMLSTVFAHNQEKEFNSYLNAVAALYNSHIGDFKRNASANCVDDPEERVDWIRNNTNFYNEVHSLSDAFIVKLMSCKYKRTDYAKNPLESQINYLGTIIKPVERYCKLDKEFFDNIKKFEKESKGRYMQAGFFGGHLISNSDKRRYQKECEDRIIEIEDIKKLYSDLLEYRKQASECICSSSDVDYYSKIEKTIEKKLSSIFSNRRQGYYYGIIAEQLSKKHTWDNPVFNNFRKYEYDKEYISIIREFNKFKNTYKGSNVQATRNDIADNVEQINKIYGDFVKHINQSEEEWMQFANLINNTTNTINSSEKESYSALLKSMIQGFYDYYYMLFINSPEDDSVQVDENYTSGAVKEIAKQKISEVQQYMNRF